MGDYDKYLPRRQDPSGPLPEERTTDWGEEAIPQEGRVVRPREFTEPIIVKAATEEEALEKLTTIARVVLATGQGLPVGVEMKNRGRAAKIASWAGEHKRGVAGALLGVVVLGGAYRALPDDYRRSTDMWAMMTGKPVVSVAQQKLLEKYEPPVMPSERAATYEISAGAEVLWYALPKGPDKHIDFRVHREGSVGEVERPNIAIFGRLGLRVVGDQEAMRKATKVNDKTGEITVDAAKLGLVPLFSPASKSTNRYRFACKGANGRCEFDESARITGELEEEVSFPTPEIYRTIEAPEGVLLNGQMTPFEPAAIANLQKDLKNFGKGENSTVRAAAFTKLRLAALERAPDVCGKKDMIRSLESFIARVVTKEAQSQGIEDPKVSVENIDDLLKLKEAYPVSPPADRPTMNIGSPNDPGSIVVRCQASKKGED